MELFRPDIIVPLGGIVMIIALVGIGSLKKIRERELQAHADLRSREMEHERRLKELEIEKARIELEKTRVGKSA